jgi:hypothetical protein
MVTVSISNHPIHLEKKAKTQAFGVVFEEFLSHSGP